MASVADILPPEDKSKQGQRSPQTQKNFRNNTISPVRGSSSSSSPSSTSSSPSRYIQLRQNLRAQRSGGNPQPLPGRERRYGQKTQTNTQNLPVPESKISKGTAMFMVSVCVALDITQALLDFVAIGVVLNHLLDIVIGLGFYVWFKIHGVDMASKKKGTALIGGFLLETFSVGALPLWTLDIILIIYLTRSEERKGVQ